MPIALLFGLVAMAILMPTLFYTAQQSQQVILSSSAAQQMSAITQAANQYVSDNYQSLVSTTSPTSPNSITLSTLIASGYLPPGFNATNAFGQTWQIEALQPAAGQLQVLVSSFGGQSIDGKTNARIAAQAGAQGGVIGGGTGNLAVPGCTAGQACGAYGGWSVATANYTNMAPGHLAALLAFNSGGALKTDYLYRIAIPGHPELNQMQANLDMGGNNLNNAQSVNANGNINAGPAGTPESGACTLDAAGHCTGQIAAAGQSETSLPSGWWGGLISRDIWGTGTIAAGTGGNVAASMNAQGQITASNSVTAGTAGTGVVVTAAGAVNAVNAGAVNASLNNNGQGYLSNTLQLGTSAGATVGASCPTNGTLAANANGSGQILSCQSNVWVAAGLPVGAVGGACSTQGGIGQDTSGNGLLCQAGAWEPIQARIGSTTMMASYVVSNGTPIPAPVCLSGGVPKVIITPQSWQINSPGSWNFRATGTGPWAASLYDGYGNALVGSALAQTYCSYR